MATRDERSQPPSDLQGAEDRTTVRGRARGWFRRGLALPFAALVLTVGPLTGCLDERVTYEVEHIPTCMLGCHDRCLMQHVGACQAGCEETWLWTQSLDLPLCGFEWEAMEEHCRGPGAGCLELYGPTLGTGQGADDSCDEARGTWEICMAGSAVFECRGHCDASCDAATLPACRTACESNWRWLDRLGPGLCQTERNQVDAQCGLSRECTAEGPLLPSESNTSECQAALDVWKVCLKAVQ